MPEPKVRSDNSKESRIKQTFFVSKEDKTDLVIDRGLNKRNVWVPSQRMKFVLLFCRTVLHYFSGL